MTGGKSIGVDDGTRFGCQEQSDLGVNHRSISEPGDRASFTKGKGKPTSGNRGRAGTQRSSRGGGGTAVETDSTLKVLGGGQLLVDDFNDADFETRKVRRGSQSCLFGESNITSNLGGTFVAQTLAIELFEVKNLCASWQHYGMAKATAHQKRFSMCAHHVDEILPYEVWGYFLRQ